VSYNNLEEVITEAVEDSQTPVESVDAEVSELAAAEEPAVESEPAVEATEEPVPDAQPEVKAEEPAQDDFDKRFGIQQTSPLGRENRIPYSRVKKITEKAVSEVAEAALGRKLNPGEKAIDVVKAHVAQLPELQSRVTDYESRLEKVGEFEHVMANQPQKFLQLLSRLPAYEGFFSALREFYEAKQSGVTPAQGQPVQQGQTDTDPMPEPDQEYPDGEKGYSMEGLKNLLAWQERRVESRVKHQIEERYKPIESAWQQEERLRAVVPVVRAKIEEARRWPLFNESEEEITQALAQDQGLSLEAAYQKVVYPKLVSDRERMRKELLDEISKAPRATSVTATKVTTKPVTPTGPRSLDDIIAGEVEKLKQGRV